jgi:hypothetical protein
MKRLQTLSENLGFALYLLLILAIFLASYWKLPVSPDLEDSIYFASKGWYNNLEYTYYRTVDIFFQNSLSHNLIYILFTGSLSFILLKGGLKWTIGIFILDPLWFMSSWQFIQITFALLLYFSRSRLRYLSLNIHIVSFGLVLFEYLSSWKVFLAIAIASAMLVTTSYWTDDIYPLVLGKIDYTLQKNYDFGLSANMLIRMSLTLLVVLMSNRRLKYGLIFSSIYLIYINYPLIGFRVYHVFFYIFLFSREISVSSKLRLAMAILPFSIYSIL